VVAALLGPENFFLAETGVRHQRSMTSLATMVSVAIVSRRPFLRWCSCWGDDSTAAVHEMATAALSNIARDIDAIVASLTLGRTSPEQLHRTWFCRRCSRCSTLDLS
jgi:hypothetical protein